MKEGRKPKYLEKTPGDELQNMPHTNPKVQALSETRDLRYCESYSELDPKLGLIFSEHETNSLKVCRGQYLVCVRAHA